MRLRGAIQDLQIAEQAIEEMARASQFPAFHRAWQDYLFRIERAWEFAERTLQPEKGFQQWFKPYARQKKQDPLLVFLNQARHAETHAISPTLDRPLRIVIRDRFGHPFRVSGINTSLEDGVLTIDVDTAAEDTLLNYEASLLPATPILVRFRNRGKSYDPPKSHLGNPLPTIHPVDAAKLGLAFYSAFIKEAAFHFDPGRASASL